MRIIFLFLSLLTSAYANSQEIKDLLDKAIEAKGGKSRLEKLDSVIIDCDAKLDISNSTFGNYFDEFGIGDYLKAMGDIEIPMSAIYTYPDDYLITMTSGFFKFSIRISGDSCCYRFLFEEQCFQNEPNIMYNVFEKVILQPYKVIPDIDSYYEDAEIVSKGNSVSLKYNTENGTGSGMTFNKENYLLNSSFEEVDLSSLGMDNIEQTYKFENYKNIGGINFPMKIKIFVEDELFETVTVKNIRVIYKKESNGDLGISLSAGMNYFPSTNDKVHTYISPAFGLNLKFYYDFGLWVNYCKPFIGTDFNDNNPDQELWESNLWSFGLSYQYSLITGKFYLQGNLGWFYGNGTNKYGISEPYEDKKIYWSGSFFGAQAVLFPFNALKNLGIFAGVSLYHSFTDDLIFASPNDAVILGHSLACMYLGLQYGF